MTAISWSSVVDNTTDAGFRTHFSELSAKLALAGAIQTADTGQINWTTAVRAAANTASGYEIWKFPDSSLFVKIEYGSGTSNLYPVIWLTVGTGSNGSGTITGQTSTRTFCGNTNPPSSATTVYPSYLSVTNNAIALLYKSGASLGSTVFFVIGKTVDSSGLATTEGFGVLNVASNAAVNMQSVRLTSPAATYTGNSLYALCAGDLASTALPSGDLQLYHCWIIDPKMRPFPWAICFRSSEITVGATVSGIAMVSTPTHTYIALGSHGNTWQGPNGQANYRLAMIYE